MTFKVGDKIRMKESCCDTGAQKGEILIVEKGLGVRSKINKSALCTCFDIWEKLTKTIRDVEVGDIIVFKNGGKTKVLAVVGDVFLTSLFSNFESSDSWYTFSEAERDGYTIYQEPSEVIEVNGKKYDKTAVEERLKELPEVK